MVGSRRTTPGRTDHLHLVVMFVLMSDRDEHQRRSPGCVFFALPNTLKSKAGRPKKGRASKASRMSTQSNFTTISEPASVADTDAYGDDSIVSIVEPAKAATSGKGAKKGAKAKKSAPKSKRQASKAVDENTQVASSFLEPEDDDFEVKVDIAPMQTKESKKRKSDGMSTLNDGSNHEEAHDHEEESQDQPKKRRATRTRGSMAQTRNAPSPPLQEEHEDDAQMADASAFPPPMSPQGQKKGKGGKKRGSSNVRKASTASTASKASLRATMPPDEEIDAVLEAELDRPLTDEDGDVEPHAMIKPKGRRLTRTKPESRKATASIAPTRRTTRASTVTIDDSTMHNIYPALPNPAEEAHMPTPDKKKHAALTHGIPEYPSSPEHFKKAKIRKVSKQRNGYNIEPEKSEEPIAATEDKMDQATPITELPQLKSWQASKRLPARNTRASDLPSSFETMGGVTNVISSTLGTQTAHVDSGHDTDASIVNKARSKEASKKAAAKKVKGGKKATVMSRNSEDTMQPFVDDESPEGQGNHTGPVDDPIGSIESVSMEVKEPKKQHKTSKETAKSGKTKNILTEPEVFAREGSAAPLKEQPSTLPEAEMSCIPPELLPAHSTPRPAHSPQSSDAENQPPSSRPSEFRPPLSMQSPPKSSIIRVPLAVTPVSSPSKNNISKLQTTFPWTVIDMEDIFGDSSTANKENSPFAFGQAGKKVQSLLTSPEKKFTVEQWIQANAQRGEEQLRNECERLVGKFEDQGVRALRVLEGIVCAERS